MNAPMDPLRLTLDPDYVRWRLEFESFELTCFGEVCDFVRLHFDDLLDDYYFEGHESLDAFPTWAFERFLRDADLTGSGDGPRRR